MRAHREAFRSVLQSIHSVSSLRDLTSVTSFGRPEGGDVELELLAIALELDLVHLDAGELETVELFAFAITFTELGDQITLVAPHQYGKLLSKTRRATGHHRCRRRSLGHDRRRNNRHLQRAQARH